MQAMRAFLALSLIMSFTLTVMSGCGRLPASLNTPANDAPTDDPDLDPDPGTSLPLDPAEPDEPPAPPNPGFMPWPAPLPERPWPPLKWNPLPNHTPYPSANWPADPGVTVPTPAPPTPPPPVVGPTPGPMPTPTPVPPPPPSDPPAGWQPSDAEEFYLTLRKFGYDGTREQAFARVRRYIGIERDVWSSRSQKALDAKWKKARTYMDPAPITLGYYDAQARAFARAPGAYYVRTDYSFREGSDLIVIKANPQTRESLAYNLKGEMTYFTQLRAMRGVPGIYYRHAIRIPPSVYQGR